MALAQVADNPEAAVLLEAGTPKTNQCTFINLRCTICLVHQLHTEGTTGTM